MGVGDVAATASKVASAPSTAGTQQPDEATAAGKGKRELTREEAEAIRKLDGMFLGLMIKELNSSPSEDEGGLFGAGPGADTYNALFEQQLTDHLSRGGGLGIGKQLEQYLRISRT